MLYHRLLALVLVIPAIASADTIRFKNGSQLTGIATVRGDALEVRVPEGSLFFARALVAEIVTETTPLAEYEKRIKALGPKDVKAAYELGVFCEAHGLHAQSDALMKQVLGLDPTHEGAHQRLGYRKVGDRWMTSSELLADLGLVQVKGEWMTPRAAKDYAELDERTRRLESRLASIEKDSGDLKSKLDDERRISDRAERTTDKRIGELEKENERLQVAKQPQYYYGYGGGLPIYGYVGRRPTQPSVPQPRSTKISEFDTAFGITPATKSIYIP